MSDGGVVAPGRGRTRAVGGVAQDREPGGAFIVTEHRGRIASVRLRMGMLAAGIVVLALYRPARAGLEDYVRKPDPAFAWTQISNHDTPLGKIDSLKLTSQVWQGITWTHTLQLYEPREVTYPDTTLLFITGGDNGDAPKDDDHKVGFSLAQVCGARVAVLHQVPNQPLLDGKTEDELIAETFVRFLQTKDENWPLLVPDGQERREGHGRRPGLGQGARQARRDTVRRRGGLEARLDDLADRRDG